MNTPYVSLRPGRKEVDKDEPFQASAGFAEHLVNHFSGDSWQLLINTSSMLNIEKHKFFPQRTQNHQQMTSTEHDVIALGNINVTVMGTCLRVLKFWIIQLLK